VRYALALVLTLSLKKNAGIPPDIPLAKQVTETGVVLPLALLAFATFFGAPVISSLVAGDIVSSEDANNTLKMILTRSTTRTTSIGPRFSPRRPTVLL
jgi:ABC-type transport system involved in multi-copper enzyme maturation permease subunit